MAYSYPEVVRILWISLALPGVNLCALSNLSIADLRRAGHFFVLRTFGGQWVDILTPSGLGKSWFVHNPQPLLPSLQFYN